jgi:lipoate-protein ligase A
MGEWRLLDDTVPKGAAMNLAIEEAIFIEKIANKNRPTVRFWINHPAVIVGYSQSVEAEVNLDVCRREGIEVVRRFSGGGTVYQDSGTLNYSIAIEADNPLVKGQDIIQSQEKLCLGVIAALRTFDIHPVFESPSNILINNKKVSGNAQARRKIVILHHGTLLVNANLDLLVKALDVPNPVRTIKGVSSKKSSVTNLSDELGWLVSIEKVKDALKKGFEQTFSVHLLKDSLSQTEERLVEKLFKEKYSRKEWNFWR